jgi:ACS family glucarate transporter-like MFS transporter
MQPSADPLAPTSTRRAYGVVGVTALAAVLLYLDRVCISFGDVYIREDLGLDKEQMGWVLGAFFFTYALAQVPSGWLSDRFGPRLTLTLYILAWSLFTGVTGLAVGFVSLLAARLAFGVAQAGAYPTAAVLIGRWVPAASRGIASSVVALGGRIGGAVAPVLTAVLLTLLIPANTSRLEPGDLLAPEQLVRQMGKPGDDTLAELRRRVRERLPASVPTSSPN